VDELEIRRLRDEDSREELTELLHRAYAELGALGFRYRAVDQDVEMTRKRLTRGECYVAARSGCPWRPRRPCRSIFSTICAVNFAPAGRACVQAPVSVGSRTHANV